MSPKFQIRANVKDGFAIDLPLLKKILYLGGPRSLQGIVRNFSALMTIRIVTLLPGATRAVSAYSVGRQVRMISSFVGLAFMSAAMARVGQNMGAKDTESAEKSGWIASGMAAFIMAVIAAAFFLIPETIMGFFTKDPGVIDMGRAFFMIIAVAEPVLAVGFSLSGALRGGGESIPPFIYSSISDLVVVIAAGYLFAIVFHMGLAGIALGMALSAVTRAIPTLLRFRLGKWKTKKLL